MEDVILYMDEKKEKTTANDENVRKKVKQPGGTRRNDRYYKDRRSKKSDIASDIKQDNANRQQVPQSKKRQIVSKGADTGRMDQNPKQTFPVNNKNGQKSTQNHQNYQNQQNQQGHSRIRYDQKKKDSYSDNSVQKHQRENRENREYREGRDNRENRYKKIHHKEVETIEDIKRDIIRIEKEIRLEIKEIVSLRLAI